MLQTLSPPRDLQIFRETGALGARIEGVDLSTVPTGEVADALRQALADHLVIYIRGERLTPEVHVALSLVFGPHTPIPHLISREDHAEIQFIRTEATPERPYVVGENWHADSTYLPAPPGGTVMRAALVPDVGGDTCFANMYQVFDSLSPALKDVLRGLDAVHAAKRVFGSQAPAYSDKEVKTMDVAKGDVETIHPVVCRHHRTGREFLYVNPVYTQRFAGWTEKESAGLLAYLYEHTARPQFHCRIRWEPEQIVVWDNRAAQHRAIPDYLGQARCLERTTFGAPPPSAER